MRLFLHFSLITALIISGCSLTPESRPPEPPPDLPEQYPLTHQKTEATAPDPWWNVLQNRDLNRFMDKVFKNNFDIRQGLARISQSRALTAKSRAAGLPWLDVQGSGGRSRQPQLARTSSSYSFSLTAGYEIDLWGRLSSRQEAAFFREKAGRTDLQSIHLTLSAQTAETWYMIALLKRKLEFANTIVELRRKQLALVRDRYRAGLLSSLDLYQTRQALNRNLDRRHRLAAELEKSRHALSVLAGDWPGKAHDIPPLDASPLPNVGLETGRPTDLLQNRPDVKAAFYRLRAANRETAAAVAARLPSFSLTGEYGGSSSELDRILDSPNILWNIMLSAAVPLIDGGRRRAEVERSKAVWRERLAAWHQSLLTAFQDVSDALAQLQAADRSFITLKKQSRETENTLSTTRDRYQQGLDNYLAVITARISHLETRTSLLEAKKAAVAGRISLARALGGDTDTEHEGRPQ